MNIETLVYTTSPTRWMSRHESRVRKNWEKAKGVKAAPFEYEHIKLSSVPLRAYSDGDIKPDWQWFFDTLTKRAEERGFNNVMLHLSRKDAKRFGIKGIAGSYNRDRVPDEVWESVIICDKGQDAKGYDNLPEYVRLAIHEPGHPAAIWTFGPDTKIVHETDSGEGVTKGKRQIESLWAHFDLNPLMYPIDKKYVAKPSQRFLAPSSHYKSGVHNGVDFPCPVGTPVYAMADGIITKTAASHPSMGGHVYFACLINGRPVWMRFLHLSKVMPRTAYRKGAIIGYTGNTGDSTGPHLHWDAWRNPVDTSLIGTANGVRKHMLDPMSLLPAV